MPGDNMMGQSLIFLKLNQLKLSHVYILIRRSHNFGHAQAKLFNYILYRLGNVYNNTKYPKPI